MSTIIPSMRLRTRLAVASFGLCACLCAPAGSAPARFVVDAARTEAHYTVTELGSYEQQGRFTGVSGYLVLDRGTAHGEVEFDVEADTVQSGWGLRDRFVRSTAMLDTRRFPRIRFRSRHFAYGDLSPSRIEGTLLLHGVERPVVLTVDRFDCAPDTSRSCTALAHARLLRSDFEMPGFTFLLGDSVELVFRLTAVRAEG